MKKNKTRKKNNIRSKSGIQSKNALHAVTTETVNIESLAHGGYGVGRTGSGIVFVPYAVPGDVLEVEIHDRHKNYSFGSAVRIISPSPDRIAPDCEHFRVCGGCSYLNMPYRKELYWKTEIFKKELEKNLKNIDKFNKIRLSYEFDGENFLAYRRKISLKVSNTGIGFYKRMSHAVVDVKYCALAIKSLNGMLSGIRKFSGSVNLPKEIKHITLSDNGVKSISIGIEPDYPEHRGGAQLGETASAISRAAGTDNAFIERSGKKPKAIETLNDSGKTGKMIFKFRNVAFSGDFPSFMQVNEKGNAKILNIIEGYIKNASSEKGGKFAGILDLYCGYGNITLFLSRYADMVTGVESSGLSVALAEKNLKINNIKNINFIQSDTRAFLEKTAGKAKTGGGKTTGSGYEIVVLDPPRAGIKGLVPYIADLGPSRVIYVSCESATLLRDLKVFSETGYEIESIHLIDMFPRTHHLEHVVFLRFNGRL